MLAKHHYIKFSKAQYSLFASAFILCTDNEFEGNFYLTVFPPFSDLSLNLGK